MEEKLYDENAIITPPNFKTVDLPIRKYKYIIDSRDRNKNVYKNPAKYNLKLDEGLTDVTRIELKLTDFKFNPYNINDNNCILHTSSLGNFTIQSGVYDGNSIATHISTLTGINTTFNPITLKLTFNSTINTTFIFKNNNPKQYDFETYVDIYPSKSVGKLLGFDIEDYDLTANVPFEAPFIVDLETENYIIMYMQQAKTYQSRNNNTHNSYAIINKLESTSDGIVMYSNEISKSFNPPIANLTNLKFRFSDYYGNLYDFQNKDHRFEMIFTLLKQTRCYNEIFN